MRVIQGKPRADIWIPGGGNTATHGAALYLFCTIFAMTHVAFDSTVHRTMTTCTLRCVAGSGSWSRRLVN